MPKHTYGCKCLNCRALVIRVNAAREIVDRGAMDGPLALSYVVQPTPDMLAASMEQARAELESLEAAA